jgi:hypothetical protein
MLYSVARADTRDGHRFEFSISPLDATYEHAHF